MLHVPYTWAPDPVGGTEVFVDALARELAPLGWQSSIAAPAMANARYEHAGLPVLRFAMGDIADDAEAQWGAGDPLAAQAFAQVLDDARPDLVHLHALTPAASVRLAAEVRRRGLPLVVTYHTPTMSCRRGTLLRYGRTVCDGRLDLTRCSRCMYQHHGVPLPLAWALGSVPPAVGQALARVTPLRKAQLAARLPSLMQLRIGAFEQLMQHANHVIAVCEWGRELLLRNGVAGSKITLSRYGIADSRIVGRQSFADAAGGMECRAALRLAFLGRLSPEKGLHVVLEALRAAPKLDARLDVYAIVQPGGSSYADRVVAMIEADPRVELRAPVPAEGVIGVLAAYDALVVPSHWLETGPQVVLEAFAAGIPVIGSRLGGIAELVEHDATGLLVEAGSVAAWRDALGSISRDSLQRLRARIRPPRSVAMNATEVAAVYAACRKP